VCDAKNDSVGLSELDKVFFRIDFDSTQKPPSPCNSDSDFATLIFIHSFSYLLFLNTFASDLNQAVRAKTTGSYVALRERNSGAESSRELFKGSKDYSLQ